MKFTLSWLKDHLDTDASLDEITARLTAIGIEVEAVENPTAKLKDFTIGLVVSAVQHPNADRLQVCMVDTGIGPPVQVVCGAPNARAGMKGVFSPPGTFIPGKNLVLGKGIIRGIESNGMLCSPAELELSDDHDGIIDLPDSAPVGARYIDYAGLGDPVIEVGLTPNRGDAASVWGIARDLAAAGIGVLRTPTPVPVEGKFASPNGVRLDLAPGDAHLCPAFALRLVRGVKNGPSPDWMQRRLRAIGLRPINALVDITNYITFDRGRPLHVFDAGKVQRDLFVRRARAGEEIMALDGRTYTLDPTMVAIADASGVESIAGIMGGEHSGCDATTADVLIESALWDPLNVAQTGRKLNITSDARYRFERGVDPTFCVPGLECATRLVLEICGGEPSQVTLAGKIPSERRRILFPLSEVKRLTGLDVPCAEMLAILSRLGFELAGSDTTVEVTTPSWRPDIEGKADLVEEIVRIAGLDQVASTPLRREEETVAKPVLTLLQKRTRTARRALASRGLIESVTWSFIARQHALVFGGGSPALQLANPIAADLSDMRPSLFPGLLAAARRNADRGRGDVALFEVGQIFLGDRETDQRMAAGAVRRGSAKSQGIGRHWSRAAGEVDAFDAKADAMALLGAIGVALGGLNVVAGGPPWFHPGRSGTLQFGPRNAVGWFGEFHPQTLEALDVKGPLCGFEIILDEIAPPKAKPTRAKPKLELVELMPVERDFAFVVDRAVPAGDILKAAQAADRSLISGLNIFDVYEGPGMPEGKKSVGLTVTLQPRQKTLTESEIDAVAGRIVAEVAKRTGASLRA
ncbi:MAG: phenylalanine--tRNA ligase subunit beta [Methylobacteriaceae bacterium]|nr:phenylalanine--tRNA ligase subunit beta [Methylobacteriaceae bacterium]